MKGISIIIPTYNRERFIRETIQSVIDQEYDGKIEIIISDDGSTDNTLQIARSFGDKVIILEKKKDCKDQGASATRNRGLKVATQPYIAFLDSDDLYLPRHLKKMGRFLEQNENVDYVFCRSLQVKTENGKTLFKAWTHKKLTKKEIEYPAISGSNIVNTNCFVFRKKIFDVVGVFDVNYPNSEDSDMWIRIGEHFSGIFLDHYGVAYRIDHGEDQLTGAEKRVISEYYKKVNAAAIERYYQQGLKDPYRILLLKIRRSNLNNQRRKYIHYINCLFLIFKYPTGFIQMIPSLWLRLFSRKKENDWKEFSYFIGS